MTDDAAKAELGAELVRLADDHGEWSRATFGSDAERGPVGPLRHLAKEAGEAEDAAHLVRETAGGCGSWTARENLRVELADCLLLLLDASRRAGLTPLDLVRAARVKLAVNKARVWPKAAADQPVEHDRGGEG